MRSQLALASGLALLVCAALAGAQVSDPLTAVTEYGLVHGVNTPYSRAWRGIPYAAPPVGSLRWQNPRAPQSWSDVLETSTFSAACPQRCELPPAACQPNLSEDCLYLNVFAPLTASPLAPLPVLVFFHGGRYEQGSEGVALYDGQILANLTNTIVVTVNYRLGVLGFMVLNEFKGNFGVLDQRFALQWIQRNIQAFGGDISRVTIFGQSAGGVSVNYHMTSQGSVGLFHGAIIQSSPYALPLLSQKDAVSHYEHFSAETKCGTLPQTKCLLNLSWEEVVSAQTAAQQKLYLNHPTVMFFPWTPTVGEDDFPIDPLDALNQGKFTPVPVIIGHVLEEAWVFINEAFPKPLNTVEGKALVDVIFSKKGVPPAIFSEYPLPANETKDTRPWLSDLATDYIIECSSRNASYALARSIPVYRYHFNHAWSFHGAWGPNDSCCEGHVCHGCELPFVFDSASLAGYNFTQDEVNLAQLMVAYWGNFAHNLDPNGVGLPTWPQVDPETDWVLQFIAPGSGPLQHVRGSYCDFWDRTGYHY